MARTLVPPTLLTGLIHAVGAGEVRRVLAGRTVFNAQDMSLSLAVSVSPEQVEEAARLLRDGAPEPVGSFQSRVQPWMLECFGEMIAGDREERNHRFLEESLELVQSTGCTREDAHKLVEYVFNRPVGDPGQEVGGVMVTLAALCLANDLVMDVAAEAELKRISQPEMVLKIRAKQQAKPKFGPLAEHVPVAISGGVLHPPLPDLSSSGEVWGAIFKWTEAPEGAGKTRASEVDRVLRRTLHAYVETDRANRRDAEIVRAVDHVSTVVKDLIRQAISTQGSSAIVADAVAERRRQIDEEEYLPAQDDDYAPGELARAAACYALLDSDVAIQTTIWPWHSAHFKPRDRRSNIVRAIALLLAEGERHDRAVARGES